MVYCFLSLIGNAFAGAEASSFNKISTQGKFFWDAPAAVDGDTTTAWMLPAEADFETLDNWIQIGGPDEPSKLSQIRVVNGYAKSDETFKDYIRVKTLKIEVWEENSKMELKPTGRFAEVNLKDTKDVQDIVLDKPLEIKSVSGGKYRFTITALHKSGKEDFPNVALTELSIFLEDQDFFPIIQVEENPVEGKNDPNDLLMDRKSSTVWKANLNTKLSLDGGESLITRLSIASGRDKRYARPKKVKVSVGGRETIQELPDSTKPAWIWLPSITGYPGGSSWDTTYVEFVEVYPGSKYPEIIISEMGVRALIPSD
ncbi:MAG: discoidin domain-containing protein [Myxococcota bacterium]|nr:discoidin domain-containing protein [Myxococcota bacterium]